MSENVFAGDIFRKEYGVLTDGQKHHMREVKEAAEKLMNLIWLDDSDNSEKNFSVARERLRECVMWACNTITMS